MANKLKFLRKAKKLTQNEVAKLINMSYSNYSKLEREEIAITSNQLKILSDFYGVSISFLLNDYKREVVISKEQYLKLIDMNEILREIIDQNADAILNDEQS